MSLEVGSGGGRMPWPPGGGHRCFPMPPGGENGGGGGVIQGGVKPGSPADVGGGPGKHAPGEGPGPGNPPQPPDRVEESKEKLRERLEQMQQNGGIGASGGNVAEVFRTANS